MGQFDFPLPYLLYSTIMVAPVEVRLGGERRVADIGLIPFGPTGNLYGILERYQRGEIKPAYQDFKEVKARLAEAAGTMLPNLLIDQLKLHEHHYALLDHPNSVTSVWFGVADESDMATLLKNAIVAIVVKRHAHTIRQSDNNLYVPDTITVSGKDGSSFLKHSSTDRGFGVAYVQTTDQTHPEISMQAIALDVAILQEENPIASPKAYRFSTLPIPTPIELSWHNMEAAGFITEGMIAKNYKGQPKYPMVVKGRIGTILGTETGRFRFSYKLPLSRNGEPIEHSTVAIDFEPLETGTDLRLTPWEVETAMYLPKAA